MGAGIERITINMYSNRKCSILFIPDVGSYLLFIPYVHSYVSTVYVMRCVKYYSMHTSV